MQPAPPPTWKYAYSVKGEDHRPIVEFIDGPARYAVWQVHRAAERRPGEWCDAVTPSGIPFQVRATPGRRRSGFVGIQ